MIWGMLLIFVVLALLGVNLGVALGLSSIAAVLMSGSFPLVTIAQRFIVGINSYTLLAVPLFILAASLMNQGGITTRLFNFARACIGHRRGSLGYVNVLASMLFAGMSGSAVADAGGLGQIEIKAMNDEGYPIEFSAAITCASSAIGPIIPPSIPFLMYAAIAEVSSGDLFIAGVTPGILMGVALMALVWYVAKKNNFPVSERQTGSQKLRALGKGILPLFAPAIILGGIMGGIFTPTEAGAVAVVYAAILGFFVYKEVTLRDMPTILSDTLITTAVVTFIMAASSGFSLILVYNRIPQAIAEAIIALTSNKYIVLMIINVVLLFLGCLMEAGVVLTLLTPLFVPIALSLNIDLIHFGVIMVLNLMIGVVTPPVGMSLYVTSNVAQIKLETLMKAVLPYVAVLIVVLLLVTYIPGISLWLVRLV